VLRERAEARPEAPLFRWLADGEEPAEGLTRGALEARARGIATVLGERLRPGEPAVLLYPPGLELVAAFFGCLAAGVVAVPAYPPRGARSLPRLRSILEDARPRAVLTESGMLGRLRKLAAGEPALAGVPLVATDGVAPEAGNGRPGPDPGPDDLAFVQYTSGSTAEPRGVMVSHGNLLHNEEAIRRAFGQTESSVVVSWLPLYHDMGLIGGVLQPVYSGGRCVLMAPAAFLRRPVRWLRAIHEHGATTSGGPDFAYALCAREVGEEERAGLDLSGWAVAFDGSEPVRPATLERFARAFAPCGFRRSAFQPCYGLAEATLFVTGGAVGEEPVVRSLDAAELERHRAVAAEGEAARAVAGCGRAAEGHRVAIADPETGRPLPPGHVGEVWVAGPSVARGYWGRPEESAEVFGARRVRGEEALGEDGPAWLRTGDLGFLDGGELFVTGRLKDLVILRGRNHYPNDLERTAELAHPAVAAGASAAFAVEAGEEERLVLACEMGRREATGPEEALAGVAGAVREAVFREHDARVHDLVLLPPGAVPRTSSGKVRRGACRAAYLAGELEGRRLRPPSHEVPPSSWSSHEVPPSSLPSHEVPPSSLQALPPDERRLRVEEVLRNRAGELLGVAPGELDPEKPLIALGLDSLGAAELAHGVERSLGVPVGSSEMAALLDGASLRDLADAVLARLEEEGNAPAVAGIPAVLPGVAAPPEDFPLSYGQRSLWFLHDLGQQRRAYVIAAAVRLSGPLDAPALRRAAEALARRHPALRTTFREEGGEPRQRVHPELRPEWTETDARNLSADALAAALREAARRPFDLAAGPLLRFALLRRAGDHVLVVAVHHVVADFWSMGILHRELDALYREEIGGRPAALDPPALHPADHVRWQAERLAGPEGERLWDYWRRALAGPPPDL
ncbi:MAG TPA: AMP-binding protein, partial [Thermoanaerobaculia bacterium]|nr:AMP-binding protein [Thermoanaerobaculia bacterium]